LFPQVRHGFRVDSHALVMVISHTLTTTLEDMGMDELELVPEEPYWVRAARIADALRKLADKLDDTPELGKLRDPVKAEVDMLDDLRTLDALAGLGTLDLL
jgi:hypothetical protein